MYQLADFDHQQNHTLHRREASHIGPEHPVQSRRTSRCPGLAGCSITRPWHAERSSSSSLSRSLWRQNISLSGAGPCQGPSCGRTFSPLSTLRPLEIVPRAFARQPAQRSEPQTWAPP